MGVFEVHRRIDGEQVTATTCIRERPNQRHDTTVLEFARLQELNGLAVGTRVVTILAVQHLESGTVRVHAVEIDRIIRPRVIPATEHDLPVRHYRGVHVVTLVETDLLDVRAIGVHNVQQERRLVVIFVKCFELWLALIEQHGIRSYLAR